MRCIAVPVFAAFLMVLLLGCGGDDKTSGGGVCPASVSGGSATWANAGPDPQCTAIAQALTEEPDDGPDAAADDCAQSMTALVLVAQGPTCHAEQRTECDGRKIELTCTVERSGHADCMALVTATEIDSGSCRLTLQIR